MPFLDTQIDREVGEFGMSIGTDLAIAGSLGRHPDRPKSSPGILAHNRLMVNVGTLVRNALSAYSTDDRRFVTTDHLYESTMEDINALNNIYLQTLPPQRHVAIVYYHNDYSNVANELRRARPRTMKTDLQKFIFTLEQSVIKEIVKVLGDQVEHYRFWIKGQHPDTAMLTHQPVDLLSRVHFRDLVLLESHTGLLKTRKTWHSKYSTKEDTSQIPFDKAMVQIFGDGNNLLASMPISIRRRVLSIASDRKWTYMTTKEKILKNATDAKEIELHLLLRDAYR